MFLVLMDSTVVDCETVCALDSGLLQLPFRQALCSSRGSVLAALEEPAGVEAAAVTSAELGGGGSGRLRRAPTEP